MLNPRVLFGAIVVCALLLLFVSGCSKVSKENYEKIALGMDYSEVVQILGNPDATTSKMGTKSCKWGSETKNISLKFVADKLIYKSNTGL